MTPPTLATTAESGVPETKSGGEAPLLDHAYDDIREYDNPLPGWWSAIFWATIVFAAGYWVWFHVTGWGRTPDAKYQIALGEYADRKETREKAELRDLSEDTFARNASDPKVMAQGREIYTARCASCHAPEGQGLIGPNLTDRYQLHGATRMDIFKVVRGGVPGTAMLAWGEQMPGGDVVAVSSFVATLRGQNLTGKEPQGAPVEPFK